MLRKRSQKLPDVYERQPDKVVSRQLTHLMPYRSFTKKAVARYPPRDAFWRYDDKEGGESTQQIASAETSLGTQANENRETNATEGKEQQHSVQQQQENANSLDEEKAFKLKSINIFYLLDQDCDTTLYKHEFEPLFKIMDKMKQSGSVSEEQRENIEQKTRDVKSLRKEELKDLLKVADQNGLPIDKLVQKVYRDRAGCLACSPCLAVRKLVLKIMRGYDRQTPEQIHYGFASVISEFLAQMTHLMDLISDSFLALQMYIASRTWEEQQRWGQIERIENEGKDYSVGFIWIVMAISGPYIIQFSSMLNAYFIKDIFDEERWESYYFPRKVQLFLQLMFFGLAILPFMDLYIKVKSLFLTLFIFLFFIQKTKQKYVDFRKWTESIYNKIFKLTFYEVESFEKQKKHTQLLFEDSLMLLLNAFIYYEVLDIPILKESGIDKKPLYFQVITTIISFVTTSFSLWIESRGLGEDFLEFIMTSVKAKQDWVPHGEKIRYDQLFQNLNFSRIEFKIWLLSDLFGLYKNHEYQFNEYSLQKLATQILAGQKESQLTMIHRNESHALHLSQLNRQSTDQSEIIGQFNPKLKFGFSLYHVSVHIFLHFIDRIQSVYPKYINEQIDFEEICFQKLIENSLELGHFMYRRRPLCSRQKPQPEMLDAKTVGGKRLIQILIDNEQVDEYGELISFPLETLLVQLLKGGWCDPNQLDFSGQDTLLTYCHNQKKRKSFEILLKYSNIDPNLKNENGTTIYGLLFYESQNEIDFFTLKEFKQPREHLKLLLEECSKKDRIMIDFNEQCVDMKTNGPLNTPFFAYFKRFENTIKLEGDQVKFDDEHFEQYFNMKGDQFVMKKDEEVLQMMSLSYMPRYQARCHQLILNKAEKKNEYFINSVDQFDNNLLHNTVCAFSEKKFQNYSQSFNNFGDMKQHLSNLMKMQNKNKQTPVDLLLANDCRFKKIERLLQFDILKQGCLDEKQQQQFIEYISMKAIKERNEFNGNLIFTKKELNRKYFNVFPDPKKAYKLQKDSFRKRDFLSLFEDIFKQPDDEFENQESSQSEVEETSSSKLDWSISNKTIIVQDNSQPVEPQVEEFNPFNLSILVKTSRNDTGELSIANKSSQKNKKTKHYLLEACLNWLIDFASTLDLISDIIILDALLTYNHTSWFSFSIFTMLCPYYAVYTSLMNFQIDRSKKIKEDTNIHWIMKIIYRSGSYLYILPTMLILLIISDLLQTLLTTLVMPIYLVSSCIKKKNRVEIFEDFIDKAWHNLVGMNYMDVRGFRSQRTILQLQLESIPQIFFQSYMLIRLHQMAQDDQQADKLGVSVNAIIFSLVMALIHMFLEFFNLYLEASTWQTGFMDYMIACHNAKINWIAQKTSFIGNYSKSGDDSQQKRSQRCCWCLCKKTKSRDKDQEQKSIVFDDKESMYCNQGFSVSFLFTDMSIESLINIISNLPMVDDMERRTTVELGSCIRELSSRKLLHLLELSYKKVNLVFVEPNKYLRGIFNSNIKLLQELRMENASGNDQSETDQESIMMDMVNKNYHQVLRVLIDLDAHTLIYDKYNKSMLSVAYSHRHSETFTELICILESNREGYLDYISRSIREDEMIYNEVFLRRPMVKRTLSPLLLMQPQFLIAFEMQQSFLYHIPRIIREKSHDVARDLYDYIWGAIVPQINFEVCDDLEQFIPVIEQWQSRYPKHYTLKYYKTQGKFDTKFLCHFAGFRRELYLLGQNCGEVFINRDFQRIIDIDNFDFEIEDLVQIQRIILDEDFNDQIDLAQCDLVINNFGLDKKRDVYFQRSRAIAQRHGNADTVQQVRRDYSVQENDESTVELTMPEQVAAIKSIQLCINKDSLSDLPAETTKLQVSFSYKLDHQKADIHNKIEVSLPNTLNSPSDELDPTSINWVPLLDFSIDNQYDLNQLAEIKVRNTLLMNIRAGNTITFKVEHPCPPSSSPLQYSLAVEFYSKEN